MSWYRHPPPCRVHLHPRSPVRRQAFISLTILPGEERSCSGQPDRIFLIIDRIANEYSGSYAYPDKPANVDQIAWKTMGTAARINFNGKVVLFAANDKDNDPEIGAEFHDLP